MVRSPHGDTNFYDIVAGVLQGDTLVQYLLILCVDYALHTFIDEIKENGFTLKKKNTKQIISGRNYNTHRRRR